MKSCLKCHSDHPVPGPSNLQSTPRPKCTHRVSFRCEDEVHTADDWDRTPVDVAHKLSYEDILELKEMQVAAAKACARASAASGVTPKYLSNVPLGLLPLLPDTSNAAAATSPTSPPTSPRSFSPSPQNSPNGVLGNGNGKSVDYSPAGLGLAEACLCRVFSADTGLPAEQAGEHQQSYGYGGQQRGSSSGISSPPPQQGKPDYSQPPQFKLINGVHQVPSPPDTPPRLSVTSIPPPPPTKKARHFAFLPLLDASSSSGSSSPARTPIASPSASGVSSPIMSPGAVKGSPVPPVSLTASLNMISSPPLSESSSSSASSSASNPSPGAYTTYDPYGGSVAVRGSATLGLERKLGYKFVESDESDSHSVSSEEGYEGDEGEDKDWPRDWPGRHPHHPHHSHSNPSSQSQSSHQHTHHHRHEPVMKSDPKTKDNRQLQQQRQQQLQHHHQQSPSLSPSRTPKLPPSPPAEPRPLPLSPLTSNYTSSPPRSASSTSPKGSPRASRMSSPSPPPPSPSRARKSKMGFPLVTLA